MKSLLSVVVFGLMLTSSASFASCQDQDVQSFIRNGIDNFLGAKNSAFKNAVTYSDLSNNVALIYVYQKPIVQQAMANLSLLPIDLAQAIAKETNSKCGSHLTPAQFGPNANIGSIQKALGLPVNP